MKTTEDRIFEKYGPRLTTGDIASVLKTSVEHVRNKISEETIGFPTYKETDANRAPRYADYRDVARYLDRLRRTASEQVSQDRGECNVSETPKTSGRTLKQPQPPKTSQNQTSEKLPHV